MRISDWSSDVCSSDLTVEGEIRAPKDGERYFALNKLISVNYDDPEVVRHRVNFDNLTPLYPTQKLTLDATDPTVKDKPAHVIAIDTTPGKGQRPLIPAPPRTRPVGRRWGKEWVRSGKSMQYANTKKQP